MFFSPFSLIFNYLVIDDPALILTCCPLAFKELFDLFISPGLFADGKDTTRCPFYKNSKPVYFNLLCLRFNAD
jgi:hypothetical protein